MASKTPETPGIRLDVGEELRVLRVQGLKHVAAIADLRARVGSLEGLWGASESRRAAVMAAAVTAIMTAIGTLVYLLLSPHG
ncbi:MAG: hypothetical protein V3W41_13075 [Planctomycetota bacterium]